MVTDSSPCRLIGPSVRWLEAARPYPAGYSMAAVNVDSEELADVVRRLRRGRGARGGGGAGGRGGPRGWGGGDRRGGAGGPRPRAVGRPSATPRATRVLELR